MKHRGRRKKTLNQNPRDLANFQEVPKSSFRDFQALIQRPTTKAYLSENQHHQAGEELQISVPSHTELRACFLEALTVTSVAGDPFVLSPWDRQRSYTLIQRVESTFSYTINHSIFSRTQMKITTERKEGLEKIHRSFWSEKVEKRASWWFPVTPWIYQAYTLISNYRGLIVNKTMIVATINIITALPLVTDGTALDAWQPVSQTYQSVEHSLGYNRRAVHSQEGCLVRYRNRFFHHGDKPPNSVLHGSYIITCNRSSVREQVSLCCSGWL